MTGAISQHMTGKVRLPSPYLHGDSKNKKVLVHQVKRLGKRVLGRRDGKSKGFSSRKKICSLTVTAGNEAWWSR